MHTHARTHARTERERDREGGRGREREKHTHTRTHTHYSLAVSNDDHKQAMFEAAVIPIVLKGKHHIFCNGILRREWKV
jgi:hypothetical protein